jgi:hypothetical protein
MQNQIRRTRNIRQSMKEVVRRHLEGVHFVWAGEYVRSLCVPMACLIKLDEALLLAAQTGTVKP